MLHHLNIDIETYSSIDIKSAGAYKYALSDDFEILLFAYSIDNNEVQIVDLAQGEKIPTEVLNFLKDESYVKHAYNAAFEWWCLNQAGYETPLEQWQCTMIHGLYCGYCAGLGATGKALGLAEDKQKLNTGLALIRYFSIPCKPTKSNGKRTRNLPEHEPEKWDLFKEYCVQDVVTEMEIAKTLAPFPVPDSEWEQWHMNTEMNARGVKIDTDLVRGALMIDDMSKSELMEEAKRLTGLENPNSTQQMINWLNGKGEEVDNLRKATVKALLQDKLDGDVRRALEIRQELAKTSVKKYQAMADAICEDNRIRGLLQFYGANRTGRWAGRLVQVQNLPRNYIETLDMARHLIEKADYKGIEMIYGNVPDTLSQLIRTAFIPSTGHVFVVSDFSAIEARVIAWLAGEKWRMEVFKSHGKIYEASAAQMFNVPLNTIVKGHENYALRAKGKVAELALGYQGSVGALKAMGADKMGLTDSELKDIVNLWRKSSPNIVQLWYDLENAALDVVENGTTVNLKCLVLKKEVNLPTGQIFLTVELPSGRKLYYPKPSLHEGKFGQQFCYYGVNQNTKKWEQIDMYGGKLVENVVQAIARDCLAVTLKRLKDKKWDIVFHVHDEVILDVPDTVKLDDVVNLMSQPVEWAPGLVLNAAGFTGNYYMKD
ncbi:hypothetical protein IX317_000611 [Fusobacterium sp. DD29]|uniref:DNA polymerase n=1 Tax=unclassified Fusobacterium TaxID=2648384 RepID=UPI001B8D30D0|nr:MULTISPECIES: DNA polymerase [unclassified Fusobacterium]MBR8700267.1 hypothetical protein [Fusobacterium sp. DD45]MBR8710478.1 hypothetical protein [Fusobacterium sp. DD28]MBR8748950.1 hypothetical protein [Fusobacterium sp. DD29]MBR8751072.1 hypothetical protein [Fusobacterium sp. DD26]MBR8761256.1 hypothetical protein [Fusobacterium sp. DD25]